MKNMLKNFVKNMLLWRRQGLFILHLRCFRRFLGNFELCGETVA